MIPDGFHLPVFMTGCSMPPKPMQRPWPPVYRHQAPTRTSFYFRPPEPPPWIDYPRMNGYREKSREYCYMAPFYRNAMPPPPQPVKLPLPRRIMLVNPNSKNCYSDCPCLHRSRSLEDVRSEVNSEWSDDEFSGYRYDNRKLEPPSRNGYGPRSKKLFEDCAKVDARRKGRPQVRVNQRAHRLVLSKASFIILFIRKL